MDFTLQVSLDTVLFTGLGYAVGHVMHQSAERVALVFLASKVAAFVSVFLIIGMEHNHWIKKYDDLDMYSFCATPLLVAPLCMQQLGLATTFSQLALSATGVAVANFLIFALIMKYT